MSFWEIVTAVIVGNLLTGIVAIICTVVGKK